MFHTVGILMTCLGLAWSSRANSKTFRSMPAISNSLVNLGKMDISFHFNSNPPDSLPSNLKVDQFSHSSSPFFIPKPEPPQQTIEFEPCPCTAMKNFKNPFIGNSPMELINKVLKSNDLFSYGQDSFSPMCCDSHENIQEETTFFDFNPKTRVQSQIPTAAMPPFPFLFDAMLPKIPPPMSTQIKPKAIEIFFFPKGKDGFKDLTKIASPKEKKAKKNEIQVVGDKNEYNNEFRSMRFDPTFPLAIKNNWIKESQEKRKNKEAQKKTQEMKMEEIVEKKMEKLVKLEEGTKQQIENKEETENKEVEKTTPAPFSPTSSATDSTPV